MGRCESCGACKSTPWWAPERLATLPPAEARAERMRFEMLERQLAESVSAPARPEQKPSDSSGAQSHAVEGALDASADSSSDASSTSSSSTSDTDSEVGMPEDAPKGVDNTENSVHEEHPSCESARIFKEHGAEAVAVSSASDLLDAFFDDDRAETIANNNASVRAVESEPWSVGQSDASDELHRVLIDNESENWFSPKGEPAFPKHPEPEVQAGEVISEPYLDDVSQKPVSRSPPSVKREDSWSTELVWVSTSEPQSEALSDESLGPSNAQKGAVLSVQAPQLDASPASGAPASPNSSMAAQMPKGKPPKQLARRDSQDETDSVETDGAALRKVLSGTSRERRDGSGRKAPGAAVSKPPRLPASEHSATGTDAQHQSSRRRMLHGSRHPSEDSDQTEAASQRPNKVSESSPSKHVAGAITEKAPMAVWDKDSVEPERRPDQEVERTRSAPPVDADRTRPEPCQECSALAGRVKQLQENIQSLKSALAVREASNLEMRARKHGSRSEQIAMLKQEISSLRVTCDYLFRKLQQAE